VFDLEKRRELMSDMKDDPRKKEYPFDKLMAHHEAKTVLATLELERRKLRRSPEYAESVSAHRYELVLSAAISLADYAKDLDRQIRTLSKRLDDFSKTPGKAG
jgi:hypothetical protein